MDSINTFPSVSWIRIENVDELSKNPGSFGLWENSTGHFTSEVLKVVEHKCPSCQGRQRCHTVDGQNLFRTTVKQWLKP